MRVACILLLSLIAVAICIVTFTRRATPSAVIGGVTLSFIACLATLVLVVLELASYAHAGDWAALGDTIDAWTGGVALLAVVVSGINVGLAWRLCHTRA